MKPCFFPSVSGALPGEAEKRVRAVTEPSSANQKDILEACRLMSLVDPPRLNIDPEEVKPLPCGTSLSDHLGLYDLVKGHAPNVAADVAFGSEQVPFPLNKVLALGYHEVPSSIIAGRYELAIEDGFKARNYFNFDPLLQSLTHPLFKALERVERNSPFSVRYRTEIEKVSYAQEWLKSGRVVHSIDQTAATDRFPLQLQLYFLHLTNADKSWNRFLHYISCYEYTVDSSLREYTDGDTIRIAVGQPMGAGYSMPLYTLTLIQLLLGACKAWGFAPDFRVLGDDLVIADDGLACWFTDFLPKLGVEISKSKGIVSDRVVEFVGATITPDSYTFPGKWKEVNNKNLYQIVKSFGHPVVWGKTKEESETCMRAIGLAQIKELCYSRAGGPLVGFQLSCELRDKVPDHIAMIEGLYNCSASDVERYYLPYTQNRVIATFQALGGSLVKCKSQSFGAARDAQVAKFLWAHPELAWFEGTEWEKDSYFSIELTLDKMQRTVEVILGKEMYDGIKTWTKAGSGSTRDIQLGTRLLGFSQWLSAWIRHPTYSETNGYFVFEMFSHLLDDIHAELRTEPSNQWKRQQQRYERFVQFAMKHHLE
jgi:hypothetical protein